MAMEELESRGAEQPESFLFCLPESGEVPWWMKPGGQRQGDLRESTARFLVAILKGEQSGREDMADFILGEHSTLDNFRQAKRRFRQDMASLTGRPAREFQREDASTRLPQI